MAYIKSHTSLRSHKKLLRLCAITGMTRTAAIGSLHLLWWWASDSVDNGDLSGVDNAYIARECDITSDPDAWIGALVDAGFLDRVNGKLVIHEQEQGLVRKSAPKQPGFFQAEPKPLPPHLSSSRFSQKWAQWQEFRRKLHSPKVDWATFFNSQLDWLATMTEEEAYSALDQSLRNGWQGLFEPRKANIRGVVGIRPAVQQPGETGSEYRKRILSEAL